MEKPEPRPEYGSSRKNDQIKQRLNEKIKNLNKRFLRWQIWAGTSTWKIRISQFLCPISLFYFTNIVSVPIL